MAHTVITLRRTRRVALAAIVVAGCLVALMFIGSIAVDRVPEYVDFGPLRFDSEVWKATPGDHSRNSVRLRMADDVLTQPIVGQPRHAIVALLGEPDSPGFFDGYALVYFLGPERHPLPIDSEWLAIRLDDAGVATECRVMTD